MELRWPPMNLCYMTQKRDAARLGPRWILRKGKFGLSASLNSVEAADPELFHTKREISRRVSESKVTKRAQRKFIFKEKKDGSSCFKILTVTTGLPWIHVSVEHFLCARDGNPRQKGSLEVSFVFCSSTWQIQLLSFQFKSANLH